MTIKIYNKNGNVRVTKICDRRELTMFSGIANGEMAEIEIGVSQYTKGAKKKIGEPAVIESEETE